MENSNTKIVSRWRDDAGSGKTADLIIDCPWEDIDLVLNDWKKIMHNYKKISVDVFLTLFSEHPSYKTVFPGFAHLTEEKLLNNQFFLMHSYAVLKGIHVIMRTLSGEYEEESRLLAVIGENHMKKGITATMMNQLKELLTYFCCDFLKSNRKEKTSWKTVMNFIFNEYLLKCYEEKTTPGITKMTKNTRAKIALQEAITSDESHLAKDMFSRDILGTKEASKEIQRSSKNFQPSKEF